MRVRNEFYNQILQQIDAEDIAYSLLLALKHKYYRVYIHSLNVAYGSYYLAKQMNLPEAECQTIALGGLFHDIGKLNISPKILYNAGQLTPKEWQVIRQHPQLGIDLLLSSKYSGRLRDIILYHHERYDGKGYGGIKGRCIPMQARIVSILDAFDAMIAYRSYKPAMTLEEGEKELLSNRYLQFDGGCVDEFLTISKEMYQCFREENRFSSQNIPLETIPSMPSWLEIGDQLHDIGIMLLDRRENVYYCNEYAAQSRQKDKTEIIGKCFYSLHKPHRIGIMKEKFKEMHSGVRTGWSRLMGRHGKYIENNYISIKDKEEKHAGTLLITTDVTERENMLRRMEKSIENLNVLIQAGQLLADVDNLEQMIRYMHLLVKKLWVLKEIRLIFRCYRGQNNVIFSNGENDDSDMLTGTFTRYRRKKIIDMRYILRNEEIVIRKLMCFKNNNSCMLEMTLAKEAIFSEYDKQLIAGIVNYLHIAIEKHLAFIDLGQMAILDSMTGLYNRHYLEVIKEDIPIDTKPVSFIVGDINNLKYYNDKYGHAIGDDLICKTAEFIKESVSSDDFAFRTGGDEFLLILSDSDAVDAQRVIHSIHRKADEWNERNNDIRADISFGYVVSGDNTDFDRLISIADNNMYHNKKKQKNRRGRECLM